MRFVVATHGHCFDGLASATLFTRLVRAITGDVDFVYHACGYGSGQPRPSETLLDGDENAILDYRYFPSPRLTWYFDHHRTAFRTDSDRTNFDRRVGDGHFFFDPEYSSCTKLIADVARERFGVADPLLDDLVRWADVIDAARFDDAAAAVDRSHPVMRMVAVVEHHGDDALLGKLIPELLSKPLLDVARGEEIERRYKPLGAKHDRFIERVKQRAERCGRVVFVDLTDAVLESVGKFVTYALFPDSTYSVIVGKLNSGVKISVGYNPWSGHELDTDISAICARHGGGGHPVVGGISFESSELERARGVAREIVHELMQ